MRLLFAVSLALFAVIPALCWPQAVEDKVDRKQERSRPKSYVQQQFYTNYGHTEQDSESEERFSQDVLDEMERQRQEEAGGTQSMSNIEQQFYQYAQAEQDSEERFSQDVLDEMEQQREEAGGTQLVNSQQTSGRALQHGCRVGLQMACNNYWLGCAQSSCCAAPCPGKFFEGADITNCWGEVFQMYRMVGSGPVKSGDYVGLYYPRQGYWFSMWGGSGRKSGCPGRPSSDDGFENRSKWCYCKGEAFIVYARGKTVGTIITDKDTIALYYRHGCRYVSFQIGGIKQSTCSAASGATTPPSDAFYDKNCVYDSVELSILD